MAVRYAEAEAVLRDAMALIDKIPMPDNFDNDLSSSLNEFADIMRRAGRTADGLALLQRIPLPDALPADATPAQTIFYVDVRESRMSYLASLDRREEAIAAAAAFRDGAVPVMDRLLANPERNVILAAAIASAATTGAVALADLGLQEDAAAIASKANALIAADDSAGVRLLAARNELVQAAAAMIRGDMEAAMPGFDRAVEAGQAILPDDSDEMLELWLGRGMARLGLARQNLGDAELALADIRQAARIAEVRIGRETRFDDMGVQRKMRPSFESLVGSAWLTGNSP
jgi:tetratricopeptide (TPR) repeat protein